MSAKHLTKETVTYQFKWYFLKKLTVPPDEDRKRKLWKVFLLTLAQDKKITPHQAETWTYPMKALK